MPKSFESCEDFEQRYGYSPQDYLVKVLVGLIHVNPARYDIPGIDPSEKAQGEAGDATRKAAAEGFVAGADILTVQSYMGTVAADIINFCPWDAAEVRAAVAAKV